MTIRAFWSKLGPPLVLAVALAACAIGLTASAAPLYEASARLEAAPTSLVREFNAAVAGRPAPLATPADPFERRDLGDLGVAARDARALVAGSERGASLAVDLDAEVRALDVVARAPTARMSASLANAFARALIAGRNKALEQRIQGLQASLRLLRALVPNSPAARRRSAQVAAELSRLRRWRGLSGGGFSIARLAEVPRESVSPRVARNGAAAALLGLLVGFTPVVAGTSWRDVLGGIRRTWRFGARATSSDAAHSR